MRDVRVSETLVTKVVASIFLQPSRHGLHCARPALKKQQIGLDLGATQAVRRVTVHNRQDGWLKNLGHHQARRERFLGSSRCILACFRYFVV